MDREIREPLELLDEIENVLKIKCVPIDLANGYRAWFRRGVYLIEVKSFYAYKSGFGLTIPEIEVRDGYNHETLR